MQAIVIAALPLIGVLVGAALQYLSGRTLEAQRHLNLQKAQAYADYFRSVASISTQGRTKDFLALAADAKTRVCIYGSHSVSENMSDFERAGAMATTEEGRAALTKLMQAMRSDIGASRLMVGETDLRRILFGDAEGPQKPGSPLPRG